MKTILNILFVLVSCSILYAQDSIKNPTDYPLDDPRNPNCPCHKLQQVADEEYKQLQTKKLTEIPPQQQKHTQVRKKEKNDSIKEINIQSNVDNQDEQVNNNIVNVNIQQIPLEKVTDQGVANTTDNEAQPVKQKSIPERENSYSGDASHRKKNNSKKLAYKVNKKLKKVFHKRKKNKRNPDDCFSWGNHNQGSFL